MARPNCARRQQNREQMHSQVAAPSQPPFQQERGRVSTLGQGRVSTLGQSQPPTPTTAISAREPRKFLPGAHPRLNYMYAGRLLKSHYLRRQSTCPPRLTFLMNPSLAAHARPHARPGGLFKLHPRLESRHSFRHLRHQCNRCKPCNPWNPHVHHCSFHPHHLLWHP